jgi:hypothetical protein
MNEATKNMKGAPSGDGWVITEWECRCHPDPGGSRWRTYSTAETCAYSDQNMFSPLYAGERHDTYESLRAAHDLIPWRVDNEPALIAEMLRLRAASE